ncbi:MAG TPA: hypothetical protein VF462_12510, partial [Micromonosporaceae bacterium]
PGGRLPGRWPPGGRLPGRRLLGRSRPGGFPPARRRRRRAAGEKVEKGRVDVVVAATGCSPLLGCPEDRHWTLPGPDHGVDLDFLAVAGVWVSVIA